LTEIEGDGAAREIGRDDEDSDAEEGKFAELAMCKGGSVGLNEGS
jgi:hypothetical protein